jgi:hypothetical protein
MKTGWYPFAIARDGALSYLTVRDLPDGPGGITPPLRDRLLSVFPKRHGTATITWPPERPGTQADS